VRALQERVFSGERFVCPSLHETGLVICHESMRLELLACLSLRSTAARRPEARGLRLLSG
jgi:hypothetical protein